MKVARLVHFAFAVLTSCQQRNQDPAAAEIVTSDLDHFWEAMDKTGPQIDPQILDKVYLARGTNGIKGFMKDRIMNAENLSMVVESHQKYFRSIRSSLDSIPLMKDQILESLVKLKDLYPDAVFPPVYFVVGALNSGGTTSDDGLIIGAEMYGLTANTPTEELDEWLKSVIKPVSQLPHIVAHELIHYQQDYHFWQQTLLAASIKEGAADFIAELISGKHINQGIHEFANPREKDLWVEFRARMNGDDYSGWLYSSSKDRPNDLGYWMGYQITKSFYDKAPDKRTAIHDILNIDDFDSFLQQSGYASKFD